MASKKSSAGTKPVPKLKSRTAFIAAPSTSDTDVLFQALRDRGIETIRLDEMMAGVSITESIRTSIEQADYVIAVMEENSPSANVLFELGMATGMGKQVLVLAPGHGEIPFPLSGLTYLRTGSQNRQAIEFGLDQLLAAPDKVKAVPQAPSFRETHPIGGLADQLLEKLRGSRSAGELRDVEIIRIIHAAIRESGVTTLAMGSKVERRYADLAVWSNDLEPWVGNPLIIEVKKSLTNKMDFRRAIEGLSALLDGARSRRGILLYVDAKPSVLYGDAYDPRVLVMSAEEFVAGLRDVGLGDMLRRLWAESARVGS